MAGFIRRFGTNVGTEVLTAIEGVVILDLAPPGNINGVSTGVVACVGEYADMTFAADVSSTGAVSTHIQPVQVTSGQDMLNKVGGFDGTLGQFGNAGGNAFVSLRNKKFAALVCVPVDLTSSFAGRAWRDLPSNTSNSNATPVVPLLGGSVAAGRDFKDGTDHVHGAERITFTALGHYKNGIDGSITAAGAAVFQTFNAASGSFLTAYNGGPVPKGAILQLGVTGTGSGGTYRVLTTAASATALDVEKLDGSSFTWVTAASLAWRIHPQTDADTGGYGGVNSALVDTSGYKIRVRPLATIAAGTVMTPVVVPDAATATSWDMLSGLTLYSHRTGGFPYDATKHAANVANNSTVGALYATSIDSLLGDAAPARNVNIVFSSRSYDLIRSKLKSHVLAASEVGIGRTAPVAPELQTLTLAQATGDASPGVGATRDERIDYCWPAVVTFVPEAVGSAYGTSDGLTTTDGILDTQADGWLAAIMSNLAPERNPGQAGPPVDTVMAPIAGFQHGLGVLGMQDYIALKAAGVAGPRNDRTSGFIFQSGITSSLVSGKKNIARRRMADFLEDSMAQSLAPYSKQPLTESLKDNITGQVDAFLNQMLSPSNPSSQRIVGYTVDDKTGNTPALEALGIYVVIASVRTLASMDSLVLQVSASEGQEVTVTAA